MADKRKVIGVDIDGVLANFIEAFRDLNERVHETKIIVEPTDWDFGNWGLSKEQLSQSWKELAKTPNFWENLNRLDDIKGEDLYRLDKEAKLYFITNRLSCVGRPLEFQTAWWLYNKFGFQFPTVIVTPNKGIVAKALKLDAFIDDYYDNMISIAEQSPNTDLYYKLSTYSVTGSVALTTVNSFGEFVEAVLKG